MNLEPGALPGLVEQLCRGAYAGVHEGLVIRCLAQAARGAHTSRDLLKRARRALHQSYGAFAKQVDVAALRRGVAALGAAPGAAELAGWCQRELAAHPSTRERWAGGPDLWRRVLAGVGPVRRLVDLGCGLNPLFLPWMGLAPDIHYHAVEAGRDLVALVTAVLDAAGQAGTAEWADLLQWRPPSAVDLVLALKLVPTLEHQERGAGSTLLAAVPALWYVVSFPTRSLGGRSRGMPATYHEVARRLAADLGAQMSTVETPLETFYVLHRG